MLSVRLLGIGAPAESSKIVLWGRPTIPYPALQETERNARPSCWPRAQVNDESGLISPTTDFFVASVLGFDWSPTRL